jgi:CBS domain-containing protein
MARYPDGIEAQRIFQKNVPSYFPGRIRRVQVPRVEVKKDRATVERAICDRPATLVYLAGQACIELHEFTSRADRIDRPDQLVIDFDPPDDQHFADVRRAELPTPRRLPAMPAGSGRRPAQEVTVTRKMRDIMSPAPVCMAAGESVSAAARAMKEHGTSTVLVLSGGRLSGLVTDRDIMVRVLAEDHDPLTTRVGDICTGDLATLGPDDEVEQAIALVRERAVRRIPVLADGTAVGMVYVGDLAPECEDKVTSPGVLASPPGL